MEGELNRLEMERNDMRVRDDVGKDKFFILHDVCYQALRAIPEGAEAKPGSNCVEVNLNDIVGGI